MLELKVSTNVATTFNINGKPAPDNYLEALANTLSPDEKQKNSQIPEDVPVYLFKVRREIEQMLREIYDIVYPNTSNRFYIAKMAHELLKSEIINGVEYDLLAQTIKIANSSVHGMEVANKHVAFVQNAYPSIKESLERAKEHVLTTYL